MKKTHFAIIVWVALCFFPARGRAGTKAHDLRSYLSSSGVEFLEQAIPHAFPAEQSFGPIEIGEWTCTSAAVESARLFTEVHSVAIELSDNRMRIQTNLDLSGDADVAVDLCLVEQACNIDFSLQNVDITLDFALPLVEGSPRITVHDAQFSTTKDDVEVSISGCALGGFATWTVNIIKRYFFSRILSLVDNFAQDDLALLVNQFLVGFSGYQSELAGIQFDARVSSLDMFRDSLQVAGSVDLQSSEPAASCLPKGEFAEPAPYEGTEPAVDMTAAHVTLAANLGLVNDAFYHVWRRGLLCLSDKILAERGLEIDFEHTVEKVLQNFPVGTHFGFDLHLEQPPRVIGHKSSQGGDLQFLLEGVQIAVQGHRPDGSTGVVDVTLDVSVTGDLTIDRSLNAIHPRIREVAINRLQIEDHLAAGKSGFDVARLRQALSESILPHALKKAKQYSTHGAYF